MSDADEAEDEVDPAELNDYGAGEPSGSERTQFGAGQRRNVSGRPKGAKNRSATVRRVANMRLTINENGRPKRLSLLEALIRRVRNDAIRGNHAALKVADQLRRYHVGDEMDVVPGVLILGEQSTTFEEWQARHLLDPAEKSVRFREITGGYYDELLKQL